MTFSSKPWNNFEFTADFLHNSSFKVRIYRMGQFILSDTIARSHTGLPQGSPLSVPLCHCFCLDAPTLSAFMDYFRRLFHYSASDDTWRNTEDER